MSSLVLSRVSYAHRDDVPLFGDVDLVLCSGWTGVVGANGAGKTTLLRLLSGELAPDAGALRSEPPGLVVRLCPQTVERSSAEIEALAASCQGSARRWLGRLELVPDELERWCELSPGERKRWQVAAALASEPGALLLDEPTNHLDAGAREILVRALAEYRGVGVVVSHDRALLNELTQHTVRIQRAALRLWSGGYDAARADWERTEQEEQERYGRLRGEQQQLAGRMAERRNEHARAEARQKTSRRMKSHKDSDMRLRLKQTRRRSAETRLAREIDKVHRKLARVGDELSEFEFQKTPGRALFVDWVPPPQPRLAELQAAELRAGESLVLRDVDVWVDRASRVRVAGVNGAGKTTLLRALVSAARVPPERVLWLPQELGEEEGCALLDLLRERAAEDRGRVLSFVAALGVVPERLLRSQRPSPGEARKLALALGLARQVWVLVLDEPTNHLDLPSIERLEQSLAHYPGALVLVTHDDAFAQRCTQTVWQLERGLVRVASG